MKQKIFFAIVFVFVCIAATAQQASVGKQINEIKRNTIYLYSEATLADESDAKDLACELLLKQISEYIGTRLDITDSSNVLVKDIKAMSESLTMMRGTMYRVFVYVKKSDIEGVQNVTIIDKETIPNVGRSIPVRNEEENVKTNTKYTSTATETKPTVSVETTHTISTNNSVSVTSETAGASNLEKWKQQAIYLLLSCNDIKDVQSKLNRLKAEYKIKRYGTADNCRSVDQSFWIIFDEKGILVTILGNENNGRVDYKTMQKSSLDRYKGMNAVWFNF